MKKRLAGRIATTALFCAGLAMMNAAPAQATDDASFPVSPQSVLEWKAGPVDIIIDSHIYPVLEWK